ncbi:MAG TPA: hypothetical protein VH143_12635 [Kofleriaceae bacterium]|jgi:hypothetical protein|nr:hypothetical protein [Kofleriaceae bacterium]
MYGQYTALPPPNAPTDTPGKLDTSPPLARPHERSRLTFDVGFGISRAGGSTASSPELAVGIGIGTWIYPSKVALLGRIAMSTVDSSDSTGPAQSGATTTLMALIGYRFL